MNQRQQERPQGCTGRMCRDALHCDATRQPATPLPWSMTAAVARFVSIGAINPNDAAYIAHAANAYPQLVEALRFVVADADKFGGVGRAVEAARALLRSLGEAE